MASIRNRTQLSRDTASSATIIGEASKRSTRPFSQPREMPDVKDINLISSDDDEDSFRTATGFCMKCNHRLGEWYNEWRKVTKSYYLPTLPGSFSLTGIEPNGKQTMASADTVFAGCCVSVLVCKKCNSTIGFVCVDSPENRADFRNQTFFRLRVIELRAADGTNNIIHPVVVNDTHVAKEKSTTIIMPSVSEVESAVSRPLQAVAERGTPASPYARAIEPKAPANKLPLPPHSQPSPNPNHAPVAAAPPHPKQEEKTPTTGVPTPSLQSRHVVPIQSPPMNGQSHPNGDAHRGPQDPYREAIIALQAGDALHAANLRNHGAVIDQLSAGYTRLMNELNTWATVIEGLGNKLDMLDKGVAQRFIQIQQQPPQPPAAAPVVSDRALEVFSTDLSKISSKANEVDELRRTIVLLEGRLARLESRPEQAVAPPPVHVSPYVQSQREPPVMHHHQTPHQSQQGHPPVYHVGQHQAPPVPYTPTQNGRGSEAPSQASQASHMQHQHHHHQAHQHHHQQHHHHHSQQLQHSQTPQQTPQHAPQAPQIQPQPQLQPQPAPALASHPSQPQQQSQQALQPAPQQAPPQVHQGPIQHAPQHSQAPPAATGSVYTPSASHTSHKLSHQTTPQAETVVPATQNTQSSGWVTVNPSGKRANGIDGRQDGLGTPLGSPKRPRLAPIEPRAYDRMDTDDSGSRLRTSSHESVLTGSQVTGSQVHSPAFHTSTFPSVPSTNEAPPDDSWRPESQRISIPPEPPMMTQSPRGRGRGGRGGRGGRPRKSQPIEVHEIGTPEWERPDWTGSQVGPDGYYHQAVTPGGTKRGGNVVRRGSGGSAQPSTRPTSSAGSPGDPYAHTKKTRTKPTRNSDGILIRKDGRPDMRSQSSAANLRKVHARKEAERAQEQGGMHTPTSGLANAPLINGDGEDIDPNSDEGRHRAIMKQMFPNGVQEGDAFQRFWPGHGSPIDRKPFIGRGVAESVSDLSTPGDTGTMSDVDDDDEEGHEGQDGDDSRMDIDTDQSTPATRPTSMPAPTLPSPQQRKAAAGNMEGVQETPPEGTSTTTTTATTATLDHSQQQHAVEAAT